MRGRKKNTIQQHLNNNTYRPSLHGIELTKSEIEFIDKINLQLLNIHKKFNDKLSTINIDNETLKYKFFNSIFQSNIKTINYLKKYKIIIDDDKELDDLIDPFKPI
jgi:hypothetical protein